MFKMLCVASMLIVAAFPAIAQSAGSGGPVSPEIVRDLAPTGKLRAAINLGNAILAQGSAQEPRGITVDLARELARRTGLPRASIFGSIVLDYLMNAAGMMLGLGLLSLFLPIPVWIRRGGSFVLLVLSLAPLWSSSRTPTRARPPDCPDGFPPGLRASSPA